ncbi:MAG: hypothetical protein HYX93_04395 [Chloroflexi bacterium]|nr:hypothetical protein [Chloroflexota bacterium]
MKWFRRYRVGFTLGVLGGVLALVALACAPASEPTSVTGEPTPATAAATATPAEELTSANPEKPTEEGTYVERAGLRFFVPKGHVAAGATVPRDPREPVYGGTFTYAMAGDPPGLDPQQTTATYMLTPNASVYERLVGPAVGPEVDIYSTAMTPQLAESWEWSNDFLTLTFHLRQGVKWQNVPPVNGREFTSEDVVATYNLFTESESVLKGIFASVEKVEAPDRYTVVFHMKSVDPSMLEGQGLTGRGFILPKEAKQFNRKALAVGTGAFSQVSDYEFKVGADYIRHPNYWAKDEAGRQLPFMDKYIIRVIPDSSARTAAFRTGKIDQGASTSAPRAVRGAAEDQSQHHLPGVRRCPEPGGHGLPPGQGALE